MDEAELELSNVGVKKWRTETELIFDEVGQGRTSRVTVLMEKEKKNLRFGDQFV
jgi:hypothetical protein